MASSKPASITAFAPRPARPTCCSAMRTTLAARTYRPHWRYAGERRDTRCQDGSPSRLLFVVPVVPVVRGHLRRQGGQDNELLRTQRSQQGCRAPGTPKRRKTGAISISSRKLCARGFAYYLHRGITRSPVTWRCRRRYKAFFGTLKDEALRVTPRLATKPEQHATYTPARDVLLQLAALLNRVPSAFTHSQTGDNYDNCRTEDRR
jgi:hypothetical protein